MNAIEKLRRARIQLNYNNPFFAYLVLNLNLKEFSKEEKEVLEKNCTMAVDVGGNLYYNPSWVEKLSESECMGTVCHETLHCALHHLIRKSNREHLLWNIAVDIAVNNILINNNFKLPSEGFIPFNNEITLKNTQITIKDLDKKTAESIYDELNGKLSKKTTKELSEGRFDEHKFGGKSIKRIEETAERWKRKLVEASVYAKNRGSVPAGMDIIIGELLEEKINWRQLLYRYITNEIQIDYSYSFPSKKSISAGFYMPHLKRESIEIMISIDTSGSVGQSELTEFMTEIISLAKSFNNIKMKVIICDCDIQEVYEIENGDIDTLLNLRMKGGGGTSHLPVFEKIKDEYPSTKLLIAFTDGYTDFPEEEYIKTIWVMPKNNHSDVPFGEVILI